MPGITGAMPRSADVLICPRHGALMRIVPEPGRRLKAPLHRCDKCTDAFRAAWAKALSHRGPGNKAKDENPCRNDARLNRISAR